MRDSFIFYRSFYEALAELSHQQQTKVVMALCEYALNGKEPDLKGSALAIFKLIRPQVDANNKKYENGKKGGRPVSPTEQKKQTITKAKPNHNQTITKPKPNVNVNDNVNGLDPLTGSKPFNADREAPDGGAPAPAEEPPTAEEIQELKMKLRKEGARG